MTKIIASRGTGKTAQLIRTAARVGGVIVANNPDYVADLAHEIGYADITVLSYNQFLTRHLGLRDKVFIDEIDAFLRYFSPEIAGYTMSLDQGGAA